MSSIWLLMALFVCHFLGDFTHCSDKRMLAAKRLGKPFTPILVHGMVHGTFMGIVLMLFKVDTILAIELYLFQTWSHALIDTLKGRMNGWFPTLQNPGLARHWYLFGFDQLLHALIIILMWAATFPMYAATLKLYHL